MFAKLGLIAALVFFPFSSLSQERSVGVTVTNAELAAQVGSDLRPIVPTTLFKTTETIYLSVSTSAPENEEIPGSLGVAWRYGRGQDAQAVHSEGKELVFSGDGVTTFEVSKPDGWPLGTYSAEIFLNGKSVEELTFRVQ